MKYFVVIDTNVLVSAVLKNNSIPGTIIELAFNGKIIPVLNKEIESEYRKVLLRPKFHLTTDIVNDIVNEFKQKGLYINETHIDIELPDPKDVVFYEVVIILQFSAKKDTFYSVHIVFNLSILLICKSRLQIVKFQSGRCLSEILICKYSKS